MFGFSFFAIRLHGFYFPFFPFCSFVIFLFLEKFLLFAPHSFHIYCSHFLYSSRSLVGAMVSYMNNFYFFAIVIIVASANSGSFLFHYFVFLHCGMSCCLFPYISYMQRQKNCLSQYTRAIRCPPWKLRERFACSRPTHLNVKSKLIGFDRHNHGWKKLVVNLVESK